MRRVLFGLLMAALAMGASGCVEPAAKANGTTPGKPADKNEPPAAKTVSPVTPEAIRAPAPTGAADDPRVLAAKESTDVVMRSIRTIRERLTALRESYTAKVASAKDLKAMADGMGPLVAAARADCDLFLRVAADVQYEFRHAPSGYAAAARLYRERSRGYRDPELAAVNEALAANFDALARDVPRRVRLTDGLIEQLTSTKEFLADTERCLRDSAAAFAVLAAGPEPVTASPAGRAFKTQFEAFLAVVDDYLNALLTPPAPKPAPAPIPAPVPPAADEPKKETPVPPPPAAPKASQPVAVPNPSVTRFAPAHSSPPAISYGPAMTAPTPVRYSPPPAVLASPNQRFGFARR